MFLAKRSKSECIGFTLEPFIISIASKLANAQTISAMEMGSRVLNPNALHGFFTCFAQNIFVSFKKGHTYW